MKIFIFFLIPLYFLSQDITLIPIPQIPELENQNEFINNKNRFLDINCDLNKGSGIFLYKIDKKTKEKKRVNNLRANGHLSIVLNTCPKSSWLNLEVAIDNHIYAYQGDLGTILDDVISANTSNDETKKQDGDLSNYNDLIPKFNTDTLAITSPTYLYLIEAKKVLTKNEMHLESYNLLTAYKTKLTEGIKLLEGSLTAEEYKTYLEILSIQPKKIILTPIPKYIEDTDEVSISFTEVKEENKKTKVASYRVNGGIAIRWNTNVFLSGLVNNSDTYFETNKSNEKYIRLENDNNFSFGLGANAEMAFRIGRPYAPTLNFGFMLPLGEDELSPFFTLGPGISFGTGKVKASFSGGWAVGKVNRIKNRYKNIDLNTLEEQPTNYLSSVWKNSWQVSIGLSFNLLKNEGDK